MHADTGGPSFYLKLAGWIDHHPRRLLAVTLVATAIISAGIPRIRFARSIDEGELPEASEMLRSLRTVNRIFGDDSRRVFVTISSPQEGRKVTTPETLRLISDLTSELTRLPFVKKSGVLSLTSVKQVEAEGDVISVRPIVRVEDQAEIEDAITKNAFIYGRLVSRDLSTTLVIAPVTGDAEITRIHDEVAGLLSRYRDRSSAVKLGILGDPEILYQLNKNIEKDIVLFVGLSVLLTLIGFFLVFRTWQGVVQPLAVIAASILWTMGLVGFHGEPITLVSATLPVVMVIIGGSYAVHVYYHLLEEEKSARGFEEAVARLLRSQASPLFMAMITTFLGGLSLLTFKIRPLQHFGVFTAWGSLVSLVLSASIVPAFHRIAGARKRPIRELPAGLRSPVERFLSNASRLATRHPRRVLIAAGAASVLSVALLTRVQIGFDAVAVFPPDHPVRQTAENMDRSFKGSRSFEIAIDSGAAEGVAQPEFLARIRRFEVECLKLEIVTRSFSVAHLIDQTHEAIAPQENSRSKPTSDQAAQYLLLLGLSGSAPQLRNLVTPDNRKAKVSLTLNSTRTIDFEDAHDRIKAIAREIFGLETQFWIGGRPMFSVAMQKYLAWGKIQNVFSTLLTLILLLLLRYRSISRSLVTSIPLCVGVLATFGLMGLFGIQLDYITAIITSFAMGMGSDFAIHLVSSVRKQLKETKDVATACELAVSGPGKVILYNAGCTILGFSVMIFSRFVPIRVFSLLICFNMVVLLALTLLIVPAVFALYKPAFAYPYQGLKVSSSEAALGTVVLAALIAAILLSDRMF